MAPELQNSNEVIAAYTNAWGEMRNVTKDRANPYFKSDYATLEAVLDQARPIWQKHGLALFQSPGKLKTVDGDKVIEITAVIMHKSGQQMSITSDVPIVPMPSRKGEESKGLSPQSFGIATTYGRRYQAMGIFGMAPTDNDGEPETEEAPVVNRKAAADDVIALLEAAETAEEIQALRQQVVDSKSKKAQEVYVRRYSELKG